ncbi:hypothetical protein D3C76_780960 [compost metagenome]
MGEAAEVLILPVAESKHGIVQAIETQRPAQHLAFESPGAVRRFAVAEGADHEQRIARTLQLLLADIRQRLHVHWQTGRLQLAGGLPGQLLGKAALAGETDEPGRGVAAGLGQAFAGVLDLAFLAPAIEVQQPAGDEEQRHAQRRECQDDAPDDAEVAAHVQCIDAGQQLRLEALVAVALMPLDRAGHRVEADLVQRTVVGRVFQQVENGRRLPGHGRHAGVVEAQVGTGGAVDAAPHRRVIGRRRRAAWRRAASTAHTFVLRRIGEQSGQALVVPLVGPGQPGQRGQEVKHQAPGAGHRVQVPVEAAAFFLPVEGQPGAPAFPLARPAQVQAGQAEEHQDQRARAGDLPTRVAHGEEAVQLQHQAEEALAGGVAQQFTGVGVEVTHGTATLTRRRGEEHFGGSVAVDADREHRDFHLRRRFDLLHQFGGWQDAGDLLLDLQHGRIQRIQDLILERDRRTGDAHQGQDQSGADAKKPVQLEQGFLQHVARLVRSKVIITARIMPWVVEKHSLYTQKPRSSG